MSALLSVSKLLARVEAAGFGERVYGRVETGEAHLPLSAVKQLAVSDTSFRDKLFDIPLPTLQGTGIGYASDVSDISYTFSAGITNIALIDALWKKYRLNDGPALVLDFGCGSGRLLRFACEFGEDVNIAACEVNTKAVAWLNETFPCEIHQIEEPYDLSFVDEPLDLIYAWSIYSHFREDEHLRWLETMMAKLAPGGMLIATIKPTSQIERMRTDPEYRRKSRGNDLDLDAFSEEAKTGFAFFKCYDDAKSADHGIDAATFGQTYISSEYIRREWAKFGKIRTTQTAVADWQDIVVIQKPPTGFLARTIFNIQCLFADLFKRP